MTSLSLGTIVSKIGYIFVHKDRSNTMKFNCQYLEKGKRKFSIENAPWQLHLGDIIIKYSDDGKHKTAHQIIELDKKMDIIPDNTKNYSGIMSDMFKNKLVEARHITGLKEG